MASTLRSMRSSLIVNRGGSLALSAALALLAAGLGTASAAAEDKLIQLAEIPIPRPNPLRAVDPIGRMLVASDEDSHATVEDSDGPDPNVVSSIATKPKAKSKADLNTIGLRYALKFLDDGDFGAATAAAYALPNPVDVKIIDWLIATSGKPEVPAKRVADVWNRLKDWPGQALFQIRFEQAMAREKPGSAFVIQAMSGRTPTTTEGTILLARSYLDLGKKAEAQALIRAYWRDGKFSDEIEAALVKEFGGLLSAADHKARMDRLLYGEQSAAALRVAKLLGKDEQALAAAVIAVIKKQKSDKLFAAVPSAKRKDPLYAYARLQSFRRADKLTDAVDVLLSAQRDPKLIDGDAWWVERRLISRLLIDKGDAKTAYRIAAGHSAESSSSIAEAEFHAGWYALEFLHDPGTAAKHFARIEAVSTMPLSQSRAEYWLGRAAAAAGDQAGAALHFKRAAAYPTTFYGQLALARLGAEKLPIAPPPKPDDNATARFEAREMVQVIHRLVAANRADRVDIFYRALAESLTDPAELALLAAMAEKEGEHQRALQVGKVAASRGIVVDALAFPTAAIPASAKTGGVEKPMVYAIARQESAFNPEAISSAGARGLLQLMPATAKQTAKKAGLPFSQGRLTSDPGYNATLGAAHLGELYGNFEGSYVMTFAAYNAGSSRVKAWVEAYGDPRDPKVDVVNWIERIPFSETRNYVQRIMENLQVYRARLGSSALRIEADLKRGPTG